MRMLIKNVLTSTTPLETLNVNGWVRTRRDSKGFSFLELNDGSSLANLQAVLEGALAETPASTGASVVVSGVLVASLGKEQAVELRAEQLTLVGPADADFPLQKKRHSFEYLRQIA